MKRIRQNLRIKDHTNNKGYIIKKHHAKPTHNLVYKSKQRPTPILTRKPSHNRAPLFNYQHAKDKSYWWESRNEGYEEWLAQKIKMLKRPPISKITVQQHCVHHRYFNELITRLNKPLIPTVESALELIADMDMQQYSACYIGRAVSSLKSHPDIKMDPDDLTFHPDIKAALQNAKKECLIKEDTRIPITPALVREFLSLVDRDSSGVMAITMKALLWVGLTCMLRQAEICTNTWEDSTILLSNMSCSLSAINITFHGWKLKCHQQTLKLPYLLGMHDEA